MGRKKLTGTTRYQIRISEQDVKRLDSIAKKLKTTRSKFTRDAVLEKLAREERRKK